MLTSLDIKIMQIKTTLRFYLTQVEWLPSRTHKKTNVGKDVESSYTTGGNVNQQYNYGK
jgi:hypothetical protein